MRAAYHIILKKKKGLKLEPGSTHTLSNPLTGILLNVISPKEQTNIVT